jgi:hypothetical protein
MWNVASIGGATVATAATAFAYHRNTAFNHHGATTGDLSDRIEACKSIDQIICVMQTIAVECSTEDAATLLSESIERFGITETCLTQLSRLHREYGADLGVRGYAINFVWAIVLEGVVEGRVIIVS